MEESENANALKGDTHLDTELCLFCNHPREDPSHDKTLRVNTWHQFRSRAPNMKRLDLSDEELYLELATRELLTKRVCAFGMIGAGFAVLQTLGVTKDEAQVEFDKFLAVLP